VSGQRTTRTGPRGPVDPWAAARALALPGPPLAHAADARVLGVPVRVEADAPALLEAALAALGGATGPVPAPGAHPRGLLPPPTIRLRLHDPDTLEGDVGALRALARTPRAAAEAPGAAGVTLDPAAAPAPSILLLPEPGRLLLAGAGAAGRAELAGSVAVAELAPAALADPRVVREVVGAVSLYLVTRRDREPVHGAAVARGGSALVLAGPSGSGKSTLAYAAWRAGLDVLADDAVYVQLEPRPQVWALPGPVHLEPAALRWFPELAGRPLVRRPDGRAKLAVELGPASAARAAEPAGLCVLAPGGPGPALEPLDPAEAVAALLAELAPGFDAFRPTIAARIRALAEPGAWRLRTGDDPRAAIPLVSGLLRGASRRAAAGSNDRPAARAEGQPSDR